MATSTELLRAAEHMRERAAAQRYPGDARRLSTAADEIEREAMRIRAVEARRTTPSWPKGWPPFAVRRRAYMLTGAGPTPSTKKCEGSGMFPWMARTMRSLWAEALSQVLKP